ncbi:hypothetical protein F4779DRAFT_615030 [Xylariaceae sp. FL0662B]|nr:hypothetical protein F4779DRAFT_615030 [Xylariaceae sp. FL0662B]
MAFVDWNGLILGRYEDADQPRLESEPEPEIGLDFEPTSETRFAERVASLPWDLRAQLAIAVVFFGAILIWYGLGRLRRDKRRLKTSAPLPAHPDEAINAMRKDYIERMEEMEERFEKALKERTEAVEGRAQKALTEQAEAIEDNVRKGLNKRIETLEARIKLDQEALEGVHGALGQRIEILEECIRTIDGKQLDQEAFNIMQRGLGQRLEKAEENLQMVEGKARASAQRIEAIDDSVRVIDSRTKALSQRVEAVEDNVSSVDGQTTLLSHDVNRGGVVIEKLQRQVKMLPDAERFRGLSRLWESRFKKVEAKIEQYRKTLEEDLAEHAESPPTLSWSHVESQEIEPSGPLYTRPPSSSFDGSTIYSSPSPSVRSPSTCSHTRTYSTASSSPTAVMPMTTPERKRIEMAGFRDMTFSARQKQLTPRNSWTK